MKNKSTYIIGSRGSELALWQANFILNELKKIGVKAEIKIIKTQGDKIQNLSFDKMEGKGFFTKELEDALLKKEIDIAVHSHKDLPTENPNGLMIAAVSYRENPAEIILVRKDSVDEKMKFSIKKNGTIGTSSARRKSQLLSFRNDFKIEDLRGNVPTRIQKLRDKKYDAIMLAFAGVERLKIDLKEFHLEVLNPDEFIPAPAQGVLAIQTREKDIELIKTLQKLNHADVKSTIDIERKILNLFDGGCQLPLGAYCTKQENEDGEEIFQVHVSLANSSSEIPKYFYFERKNAEGSAEKIVEKIKKSKASKIFISRDERKNDVFVNCLKSHKYKVFSKTLIDTKIIKIRPFPKTEWIFFSSKNGVKYFFEQNPQLLPNVKFGCIGKATSAELRAQGKKADFIGYSTDSKLTGKQFASRIGSKKVLFPQAKGSLRTIQQQFTYKEQIIDLPVYETIKQNEELIPDVDILVFTSPSNVEAFLEKNKIKENQKIVAMGDATANALREKGFKANAMPPSFDDIGLLKAVFSIS